MSPYWKGPNLDSMEKHLTPPLISSYPSLQSAFWGMERLLVTLIASFLGSKTQATVPATAKGAVIQGIGSPFPTTVKLSTRESHRYVQIPRAFS